MAISKEYITLPIGEIKPYENNPRINDDAVADVVESIKQCGELDPIEVDENNIILSGHTRLKAYNQLGYDSISVLRITGLTEPQKRKYRLLTNKTGEVAAWDFDKLELELEGLDFDGFDFGFEVDTPDFSAEGSHKETPPDEQKDANASNFNYKEQYGVIVMCSNEKEQESIYNRLISEGFSCKVVAV